MKKEDNILEKYSGRRPFTTPEGYFENLTDSIMAVLPQEESGQENAVKVTMWMRVRPYVYMAAAFAGIFFCVRLALGITSKDDNMQIAQTEEMTIYTDEYIDSFLETAMIDDYTIYYSLVDINN
ncbi:MAG TPA: hypothetical protein PK938_00830 [Bacteroidaceae bacterium]|nr:hypothetical protein [Bacteroidaceae bacterium]